MAQYNKTMVKEFFFDKFDANAVIEISEQFKEFNFYEENILNNNNFLKAVKKNFSSEIQKTLKDMGIGFGPDALVIHDIPIDKSITEYGDLENKVKVKSRQSEALLTAICSMMGGSLQREESSHQTGYIQQIHPLPEHQKESSGRGSEPLPFHVENVFVEKPPTFLALTCLTGQSDVKTELLGVKEVLNYLDEKTIKVLKLPVYTVRSADGFKPKALKNTPILHDFDNWIVARFYEEDRIYSDNQEAQEAIKALKIAIEKAKESSITSLIFKPGTAVIFANGTGKNEPAGVLHGRSGKINVTEKNQGDIPRQRWLQRVCIQVSANKG